MKHLTLIVTFLLCTINALADCAGSGMYFWPIGRTIKQNSLIVLEGYAESQQIVNGLNGKFPVYLKSGDHKVKLKIKEIAVGEFDLTQAILVPEEKLVAGQDYRLFIDNLPESEEPLQKWNYETKEYEPVEWKVESGTDTEKPKWVSKPVEKEKILIYYGCGPETYVKFKYKVEDASEFLIKTYVTNTRTKKTTTYYLTPDKNMFSVGHGMCAGAFRFRGGEVFEVSFDLVDASGNITNWVDNKISFIKPTEENSKG